MDKCEEQNGRKTKILEYFGRKEKLNVFWKCRKSEKKFSRKLVIEKEKKIRNLFLFENKMNIIVIVLLIIVQNGNAFWCEKVDTEAKIVYFQPVDGEDCSILENGYEKNSAGTTSNTLKLYDMSKYDKMVVNV